MESKVLLIDTSDLQLFPRNIGIGTLPLVFHSTSTLGHLYICLNLLHMSQVSSENQNNIYNMGRLLHKSMYIPVWYWGERYRYYWSVWWVSGRVVGDDFSWNWLCIQCHCVLHKPHLNSFFLRLEKRIFGGIMIKCDNGTYMAFSISATWEIFIESGGRDMHSLP